MVYLMYTDYLLCTSAIRPVQVENRSYTWLTQFGAHIRPYITDDTSGILGVHGQYAVYVSHTPYARSYTSYTKFGAYIRPYITDDT